MTSVYNLGCFAGVLSTLFTGDRLGRPRVLILGSSVVALGAILQAASYGPTQMYIGQRVAVRDVEDAQSRKAHHHPDSQMHHGLCHLQLADVSLSDLCVFLGWDAVRSSCLHTYSANSSLDF